MNFIVPVAFAFAAVLPVIVLMYLLRLRRQKIPFSSILLWRKSIQDLQANAPFQKLRNNLLLWLQLLIACLLVLALARPMMNLAARRGQSFVVLIDTSASMKTQENGRTRTELARSALKTMINDMSKNDEMMIVAFDREARVLQPFTDDRSTLNRVADQISHRDTTSNIRDALLLARSTSEARATPITISGETAKGESNVEVVVLSDGAIQDLERTPENLPPVRYVRIGSNAENIGIINADLRDTFERESDRQILATVGNFGNASAESILECYLDGQLIDAKPVSIGAGQRSSVIFTNLKDRSGKVELRLKNNDQLPADNVAYGVLSKALPTQVLLVGNKNVFLEKMLAANPAFTVSQVTPDKYAPSPGFAVTIFDNFVPAQLAPGRYLIFNAVPPVEGFTAVSPPLTYPAIIDWNRVHPLTRYVNFQSINISEAIHAQTPSWAQTLAEGETSPLIFAFERDQRQVVVVAFDIFQSDWPLRVSFPVFIANALNYLARSGGSSDTFAYASGSVLPFMAEENARKVEISSPSGDRHQLEVGPGTTMYFSQTNETGFYQTKSEGSERDFAVSLVSAAESDIRPRDTLEMSNREIQANPSALKQNREIWPWFVIAGLAILALEWLIYCRRAWI